MCRDFFVLSISFERVVVFMNEPRKREILSFSASDSVLGDQKC